MDNLFRALALSACFAASTASAASGVLVAEHDGKASLLISGDLEENDDIRIGAMVSTFGPANITATMLTSNGGDVETAFRLSDLVNLRIGKPVYVVGGCYSACAFVALAAGDRLTVLTGGKLAVHQVWVKDGQADLQLTKQITDWLRDCGVPESILKKVLSTTPQNMAKISTNELAGDGRSRGVNMPMVGGITILDAMQTLCLLALLGLCWIQHKHLLWLGNELHRVKRVQLHFDKQLENLERKYRG